MTVSSGCGRATGHGEPFTDFTDSVARTGLDCIDAEAGQEIRFPGPDGPLVTMCAGRVPGREAAAVNRPTATTILVLGNTGDPILPLQDSVAMSRDLARARLLTVDGYGHTEFGNPSACATGYEIRYLLTGALPPPRTICQENATPFPG